MSKKEGGESQSHIQCDFQGLAEPSRNCDIICVHAQGLGSWRANGP